MKNTVEQKADDDQAVSGNEPDLRLLLEQERRLYEAIVQEQREFVCRFKPDTTLTFVNNSYCRYFNRSREQLLGTKFIDFTPERLHQGIWASLAELKPGSTSTFEHSDIRRDGKHVWLHWHHSALTDNDGNVVEIQAVGRDISDMKLREERLRLKREHFAAVLDDQEEPILRFTPDGVRTFVNRAYCVLRDRPAGALLGKSFYDWHTKEMGAKLRAFLEAIGPGEVSTFEVEDDSIARGPRWIQWSTRALPDGRGGVAEYQSVGRDVTEVRRYQRALETLNTVAADSDRSSSERIRTLLEYGCDHLGVEIGILSNVEGDTYRVVQIVGNDQSISEGDEFQLGDASCIHAIVGGEPVIFERASGQEIGEHPCFRETGVEAFAAAPVYVQGEVFGTLNFSSIGVAKRRFTKNDLDFLRLFAHWVGALLTDEKQKRALQQENALRAEAELLLERQVVLLEQSNAELEQFAYIASHDLKEPLRKIESASSFLLCDYADVLETDARELLEVSSDAASRMRSLIEDLLRFARIGTAELEIENVNLEVPLLEAMKNLSGAIEESGAEITYGGMPDMNCDPGLVRQLFQNLLSNAIKYRGEAAPRIKVDIEPEADVWRVAVSDNGIGIDRKYAQRIFEIFQRLHGRAEFSGTGIGLAICKRIVERHEGRIWLDEDYEGGSRFVFTLPRQVMCAPVKHR